MSDAITQASGNTTSTASTQATAGAAAPAPAAPAAAPVAAAPAGASQQATEGQTAAPAPAPAPAAAAPAEPGKTEPAKAAVVPEKYEFKAPAGIELDADTTGAFSEVAREAGLTQEAAQKVIDSIAPKLAAQNAKAVSQAIERVNTEWVNTVKADPEIGGEKLGENLAVAKKAIERFTSPALRGLLEPFHPEKNPKGMGLGNNPEVIRMFLQIGKAISEDKFVPGGTQAKGEKPDTASVLYPQQAKR